MRVDIREAEDLCEIDDGTLICSSDFAAEIDSVAAPVKPCKRSSSTSAETKSGLPSDLSATRGASWGVKTPAFACRTIPSRHASGEARILPAFMIPASSSSTC